MNSAITERTIESFNLNVELFRFINGNHNPFWDQVFMAIRYAGTGYILAPVIAILIWKRKDLIKPLLLSVVASGIVVHILKQVLAGPRPGALLAGTDNHLGLKWNSFPSADAAMAFAVASALLPGQPRWLKALLVIYGFTIAYERVYLGAHFPLDVAAGGIIGAVSGIIATRLYGRKKARMASGDEG